MLTCRGSFMSYTWPAAARACRSNPAARHRRRIHTPVRHLPAARQFLQSAALRQTDRPMSDQEIHAPTEATGLQGDGESQVANRHGGKDASGLQPASPVESAPRRLQYLPAFRFVFDHPDWFTTVVYASLIGFLPVLGQIASF